MYCICIYTYTYMLIIKIFYVYIYNHSLYWTIPYIFYARSLIFEMCIIEPILRNIMSGEDISGGAEVRVIDGSSLFRGIHSLSVNKAIYTHANYVIKAVTVEKAGHQQTY